MTKTYTVNHTFSVLAAKGKTYKSELYERTMESTEYKDYLRQREIESDKRYIETCNYLDRIFDIRSDK